MSSNELKDLRAGTEWDLPASKLRKLQEAGVLNRIYEQQQTSTIDPTIGLDPSIMEHDYDETDHTLSLGDSLMRSPDYLIPPEDKEEEETLSETSREDENSAKYPEFEGSVMETFQIDVTSPHHLSDPELLCRKLTHLIKLVGNGRIKPEQVKFVHKNVEKPNTKIIQDKGDNTIDSLEAKENLTLNEDHKETRERSAQSKRASQKVDNDEKLYESHPFIKRIADGVEIPHILNPKRTLKIDKEHPDFNLIRIKEVYPKYHQFPKDFAKFLITIAQMSKKWDFYRRTYNWVLFAESGMEH